MTAWSCGRGLDLKSPIEMMSGTTTCLCEGIRGEPGLIPRESNTAVWSCPYASSPGAEGMLWRRPEMHGALNYL